LQKENFRRYLQVKYREKNIDVIVLFGSLALEFMLSTRSELSSPCRWSFARWTKPRFAQLKLPPDVSGSTIQLSLHDMVAMARVVMPALERIAMVGQPFDAPVFIAISSKTCLRIVALGFLTLRSDVIDLTGLPMTEVRKRVAVLPENTAILYTGFLSTEQGLRLIHGRTGGHRRSGQTGRS